MTCDLAVQVSCYSRKLTFWGGFAMFTWTGASLASKKTTFIDVGILSSSTSSSL